VENGNGDTTYIAQVHVKSTQPILVVEEFEHLLHNVYCSDASVTLTFVSGLDWDTTTAALDELVLGHLVTSHEGCNLEDERATFRYVQEEPTMRYN
jgi:hypothetical protein